jgi:2-polyprenyl-3-methyl-5-hydroxy-6-metoxy-1,4-benzoquinol methylase
MEQRSFRDPAGTVVHTQGRVLRYVNPAGAADLAAFLNSAPPRNVVATAVLETQADGTTVLEHERIPFPSFPYEWTPAMLQSAALLTLDIAQQIVPRGLGLKDATPFNILWRGPEPVFVDILSFERRDPRDATWLPLAQFQRTFVLPLLSGYPLDRIFLAHREGLDRLPFRWDRTYLTESAIPNWLASRQDSSIYKKRLQDNPEKASYILDSLLTRQRRIIERLRPPTRKSVWTQYTGTSTHYSAEQAAAKRNFVEQALRDFSPKRVLDIGCNTGLFSAIAALGGASVVAIDADPEVVTATWNRARAEQLDILPLTVNIASPSPSTGWRNNECSSFLERAGGYFDCVFMLALVHHLLVTERIPLTQIIEQVAALTSDLAVIEFVAPDDEMFRRLTRGREALHVNDTRDAFEAALQTHFRTLRVLHFPTRSLYLVRK